MGNLRSNYRQDHIEDDEQYETDKTFNLLCLKNGGAYRYRKVSKCDRHKELDSFLQEQGVSGALIESVQKFRESYPVAKNIA